MKLIIYEDACIKNKHFILRIDRHDLVTVELTKEDKKIIKRCDKISDVLIALALISKRLEEQYDNGE